MSRLRPTWVLVVVAAAVLFGLGRCSVAPPPEAAPETKPGAAARVWSCPMHAQIRKPEPGDCPICGMDLVEIEAGADLSSRRIELTPQAAALAEVETIKVERRAVDHVTRLVGKVAVDETRLKHITAWIPGRLERLYVDFTGIRVKRGEHLVSLYSPQLVSAQQELVQAVRTATATGDSGSDLLLASVREKLRLLGLTAKQVAAIEASGKAQDHVTIYAPQGGVVVSKRKSQGDYVKTGERLYTIADLSRLWVKLDAYESDLTWIRYGQPVTFTAEARPGERFEGRVVFVDPVVQERTRTVKVRLNVDNADGRLKPGMFVRATLRSPVGASGQTMDPSLAGKWICPMHLAVNRDAPGGCPLCGMPLVVAEKVYRSRARSAKSPLVVPRSAVLWTGIRSLVYVRLPGDAPAFEGREVELGPRAGDHVVIKAGLKAGERVVVRGAFKIDSALQIEARPSMMLPTRTQSATPRVKRTALAQPSDLRADLAQVYDACLALQHALSKDDLTQAKAAAARLRAVTEGSPGEGEWKGLRLRLRGAASAIAAAKDLAGARTAFYPFSLAALETVRRLGPAGPAPLREAFCPMARDDQGAPWLQSAEAVENPYFGSGMYRCGDIRETFQPRSPPASRPASRPAGGGPR